MVLQIEKVLATLARDPVLVDRLRQQGMRYARECLSWDGKAQIMTQILSWVAGQGPKPDLCYSKETVPSPERQRNDRPVTANGVARFARAE